MCLSCKLSSVFAEWLIPSLIPQPSRLLVCCFKLHHKEKRCSGARADCPNLHLEAALQLRSRDAVWETADLGWRSAGVRRPSTEEAIWRTNVTSSQQHRETQYLSVRVSFFLSHPFGEHTWKHTWTLAAHLWVCALGFVGSLASSQRRLGLRQDGGATHMQTPGKQLAFKVRLHLSLLTWTQLKENKKRLQIWRKMTSSDGREA